MFGKLNNKFTRTGLSIMLISFFIIGIGALQGFTAPQNELIIDH